jgi:hypothetical protein
VDYFHSVRANRATADVLVCNYQQKVVRAIRRQKEGVIVERCITTTVSLPVFYAKKRWILRFSLATGGSLYTVTITCQPQVSRQPVSHDLVVIG